MAKDPSVKILTFYHKRDILFENDIIQPLHLGRKVASEKSKDGQISSEELNWLKSSMEGDDTGDNISHLNRCFAEMTGIYWAWKNYDQLGTPDYIGFMHYRSLFFFGPYPAYKEENFLDKIGCPYLRRILKYADVDVICGFVDYLEYSAEENHHNLVVYEKRERRDEHLEYTKQWIKENRPDIYPLFEKYLKGKINGPQKNMFIMRKDLFFEYCEFIFPCMFAVWEKFKDTIENPSNNRLIGILAEYVTAFWLTYLKERGCNTLSFPVVRPDFEMNHLSDLSKNVYYARHYIRTWLLQLKYGMLSKLRGGKKGKKYQLKFNEMKRIRAEIKTMLNSKENQ